VITADAATRATLRYYLAHLKEEVDDAFAWISEGIDAGGQLAVVTALRVTADYEGGDGGVPAMISDLCRAYSTACVQQMDDEPEVPRDAWIVSPGFIEYVAALAVPLKVARA
jgi:hypothetical protein